MQQCKLFLLRYVPDAVRNEFVNVGLILLPPDSSPELRLVKDWSRVSALDPRADLEMLQAFGDELRLRFDKKEDRELTLQKMQDWLSNTLQISESKACLTESPREEADELARLYLEARKGGTPRSESARQMILRRMEREFKAAGVWQAMSRQIAAAKYTQSGDPLKIDCGYSADSILKMFHAVPLNSDMNSVKALAFTFPRMAEGIRRIEGKQAQLTAIVQDSLSEEDQNVQFAREILESQKILIAQVAQLSEIANIAAGEIRQQLP